jgi:hypothetical protein
MCSIFFKIITTNIVFFFDKIQHFNKSMGLILMISKKKLFDFKFRTQWDTTFSHKIGIFQVYSYKYKVMAMHYPIEPEFKPHQNSWYSKCPNCFLIKNFIKSGIFNIPQSFQKTTILFLFNFFFSKINNKKKTQKSGKINRVFSNYYLIFL